MTWLLNVGIATSQAAIIPGEGMPWVRASPGPVAGTNPVGSGVDAGSRAKDAGVVDDTLEPAHWIGRVLVALHTGGRAVAE